MKRVPPDKLSSVGQLFVDVCGSSSSRTFIRSHQGNRISYGRGLFDIAGLIAFLSDRGIGRGDRVILQVDDATASLRLVLACAVLGVIFAPVSTLFSIDYVQRVYRRIEAKALLTCTGSVNERCPQSDIVTHDIVPSDRASEEEMSSSQFAWAWRTIEARVSSVRGTDVFMIQPTSGSTGEPKFVLRTHDSVLRYARYLSVELGDGGAPHMSFLMAPRLTHAFGFHILGTALQMAAELHLPSLQDTSMRLREVLSFNSNVLPLLPRVVRSLHRQAEDEMPNEGFALGSAARFLLTAGAPSDPELLGPIARNGVKIVEFYGSSEASLISLTPSGKWRAHKAGKLLPDVSMRIAEDGEILVRSPGQMLGYHNDDAQTWEAYTLDGYYRTGDLGRLDAEGYLEILGRRSDTLNTPEGSNIYPERIENMLESIPEVTQAILLADDEAGLVALLALRPRAGMPLVARIGDELDRINLGLEAAERISRFCLAEAPFDPELYCLTGPGKVRRNRRAAKSAIARLSSELFPVAVSAASGGRI